MISQAIKIFLRYLLNNKFYTLTLIIGFSLSFSVSALLIIHLVRENTTDSFHERYKSVYRILMNEPVSQKMGPVTFHHLAGKLEQDFPEVELATHIYYPRKTKIFLKNSPGSQYFEEQRLFYADENFLKIFAFKCLVGDAKVALKDPNSIVLTEELATKYFGSTTVLDSILYIKDKPFKVTAVIQLQTENTHLKFDLLLSKSSLKQSDFALDYAGITYVRLSQDANVLLIEDILAANQNKYLPMEPEIASVRPFLLQPLQSAYFYSDTPIFLTSILKSGNKDATRMLAMVAIVILMLAMFNYINFAQSKSLFTQKQNLIRQVYGATKGSLGTSIIIESFILVGFSVLIGLLVTILFIPIFNNLFETDIQFMFLTDIKVLGIVLSLVILMAIVLGLMSYYAMSKISRNSNQGLQTHSEPKSSKVADLVFILQLTGSSILVAITITVISQVNFVKRQSPGFDPTSIVEINLSALPSSVSFRAVKDKLQSVPGVSSATLTLGSPLSGRWTTSLALNDEQVEVGSFVGDKDYLDVFRFELVKGRFFDPNIASDTAAILINESGERLLQLDENFEPSDRNIKLSSKIIGVIKDFHYNSFRDAIGPSIIGLNDFRISDDFGSVKIAVRCSMIDEQEILHLKKALKDLSPDTPFEYIVLQEKYQSLHKGDVSQLNMILSGSIISLVISIFGIVGLSMFLSARKIKEVAIRKALGASSSSIVTMFITRLLFLVLVAFVLSTPFSYMFASEWLSGFVCKTPLSPLSWMFAFVFMVIITLGAVFHILYQSARRNPAGVLRHE